MRPSLLRSRSSVHTLSAVSPNVGRTLAPHAAAALDVPVVISEIADLCISPGIAKPNLPGRVERLPNGLLNVVVERRGIDLERTKGRHRGRNSEAIVGDPHEVGTSAVQAAAQLDGYECSGVRVVVSCEHAVHDLALKHGFDVDVGGEVCVELRVIAYSGPS